MTIEGFLLIGIFLAFVAIPLERFFKTNLGYVLALYPASMFAWGLANRLDLAGTYTTRPWIGHLDINLSFGLDAVGSLFWLMVSGIGTLIFIYASGYMKNEIGRLMTWLVAFTVAMLGIVSAQNLITLFVAWELTSITSFMLIGFKFQAEDSRTSALQALLVTAMGGLVLLAGLVVLGIENSSFEFADLETASPVAITLIAIGCFTKSAQFPFHFWLPNAMAAPTPVSAFLHSATMVKAGVFLLAKFTALFGPQPLIAYFGAGTLALGSLLALGERDLKRILAWSTVAALGSMVMLSGLGTPYAAEALAITIVAHACYKGALFMCAGTVDILTGTRDVFRLGQFGKKEPILAFAAALAGLSFAGIPIFLGFVKKEAQLHASQDPWILASILISGACSVVAAFNVAARPFWLKPLNGEPALEPKQKTNFGLVLGASVLSISGIIGGYFVTPLGENFLSYVATQVAGEKVKNYLAFWHGINNELIMSLCAIGVGIVLTALWPRLYRLYESLQKAIPVTTESVLREGLNQAFTFGRFVVDQMRTLSFRQQMLGYFAAFILIFVYVYVTRPFIINLSADFQGLSAVHEVILCIFAVTAAFAAILAKNRMGTVATLGVVGVAITLTFVTFSAPDLALTQLLIEVLSVILFVLIFSHLPRVRTFNTTLNSFRDAAVAGIFGLVMTMLVLGVLSVDKPSEISDYYAQTSYEKAKGKNVVNTILVDFRGIDTLGEITVLCVAALGAHTLIRFRPIKKKEEPAIE